MVANARDKEISGVPYFEIANDANPDRVVRFSGAQGPDVFVRTFARL